MSISNAIDDCYELRFHFKDLNCGCRNKHKRARRQIFNLKVLVSYTGIRKCSILMLWFPHGCFFAPKIQTHCRDSKWSRSKRCPYIIALNCNVVLQSKLRHVLSRVSNLLIILVGVFDMLSNISRNNNYCFVAIVAI